MKTIFVCDKCGQEFESKMMAYVHERQCIDNMDMKKAVLMYEETYNDPYSQAVCKHCDNHYLVYGCELSCKYSNVCGKHNKYPYFNEGVKNGI